ncbi:hypothetical protein [Bosea thiooxidans]
MRPGKYLSIALVSAAVLPWCLETARAADRLQGAWVTSAAPCDEVFTKRNGRVAFKPNAEDWSAFIVDGKHVRGARVTCDLISAKQKGDVTSFLLGCKSRIMFGTISVSARFENDDKFVRFDPEFPEVETIYNRCSR